MSTLFDSLVERRATHAQVVAAYQAEVQRCRSWLASPGRIDLDVEVMRRQLNTAKRLLQAVCPAQAPLL